MKRASIKKSVRFEVFKRDNFACQYCGSAAPDVVLHLDHINPVAGGGGNDIINLVTSCVDCNLGKGAKELDDKSAIAKQRQQLEELNERREQLEMMLSWREALSTISDDEIDAIELVFSERTGRSFTESGRKTVAKWLKRHAVADLIRGMDSALDSYFKDGDPDDDERHAELASKAFKMMPRILSAQSKYADRPYMKDLFYIRAIVRNRMYCNERVAIDMLEEAYERGIHLDDLKRLATTSRNWTVWRDNLQDWIDET